MPILDFLWVLLGILLYINRSLALYSDYRRSRLLREILRDESYMPTQKRVQSWENRLNTDRDEIPSPQECCPSLTQKIAPLGGLSRDGALLQLFRDENNVQQFYETTCVEGIENQPCQFVNNSAWRSRCEQKYTYTYAVVKNFNVTGDYRIDYMKVKSGCSCLVDGPVEPPRVNLVQELMNDLTEIEEFLEDV